MTTINLSEQSRCKRCGAYYIMYVPGRELCSDCMQVPFALETPVIIPPPAPTPIIWPPKQEPWQLPPTNICHNVDKEPTHEEE